MIDLNIPFTDKVIAKFFKRVSISSSGCWIWSGNKNPEGYGSFSLASLVGRFCSTSAHRVAYRIFYGSIPDGQDIHHTCGNPSCVHPAHLEEASRKEHLVNLTPRSAAYLSSRKTHCVRGHEFTAENTYTDPRGHRHCRACKAIYWAEWHEQKKERIRQKGRERYRKNREAILSKVHARRAAEIAQRQQGGRGMVGE